MPMKFNFATLLMLMIVSACSVANDYAECEAFVGGSKQYLSEIYDDVAKVPEDSTSDYMIDFVDGNLELAIQHYDFLHTCLDKIYTNDNQNTYSSLAKALISSTVHAGDLRIFMSISRDKFLSKRNGPKDSVAFFKEMGEFHQSELIK